MSLINLQRRPCCVKFIVIFFIFLPIWQGQVVCQQPDGLEKTLSDLKSDRYSISQAAAEELGFSEFHEPGALSEWFKEESNATRLNKAIKSQLSDKDFQTLLSTNRTDDIVACVLGMIARLGTKFGATKKDLVVPILNDDMRSLILRLQSFRAVCAITPPQASVFAMIEDVETTLGIDRVERLYRDVLDQPKSENTRQDYIGVIMHATWTLSCLEETRHLKSEEKEILEFFRTRKDKISKLWALVVISALAPEDKVSIIAKDLIKDSDQAIRFFACNILCALEKDNEKRSALISSAKLSRFDVADLKSEYLTK